MDGVLIYFFADELRGQVLEAILPFPSEKHSILLLCIILKWKRCIMHNPLDTNVHTCINNKIYMGYKSGTPQVYSELYAMYLHHLKRENESRDVCHLSCMQRE